jgi:hypothetical protein
MKRSFWAGAVLAVAIVSWAADSDKSPVSANPLVDIQGRVSSVEPFHAGHGMPSMVVELNGNPTVVMLGSMRYLMEQNFSPKAGMEVRVKGYKLRDVVVAVEIKLVAANQSLRLRDENGWPLWRRHGSGHGRGGGHEH